VQRTVPLEARAYAARHASVRIPLRVSSSRPRVLETTTYDILRAVKNPERLVAPSVSILSLFGVVGLVAIAPLAMAHCGSSDTPASPDASTEPEAGATTIDYRPQGCAYSVSPPETRAFIDLALDEATAPSDAAGAAPLRVRLGLGGGTTKGAAGYADPSTTAAFTWETKAKTKNAKVRFGDDPSTLSEVRSGFVWTSPPPRVGIGANEPEVYMHEVHVCGLTAGKTYYYQVGGGAAGQEVWSATQTFTTVPASGKINIGVFGDARDKVTTWQYVHQRMVDPAAGVALTLVSGDMVDFGTQASLYTQWLDAIWHDPGDPAKYLTLGQIMMVPVAGNHENDAAQFYSSFAIPGEGAQAEQYASFDIGNTHFAMIDDEPIAAAPGGPVAPAILSWLDADLAKAQADRAKHPFLVVIHHRGLFTTSSHANDTDVHEARGALVPIFDKYHVDLVINGHDHEYERSKPLKAGSPASGPPAIQTSPAQGTIYVVNAGAGAEAYKGDTFKSDYREGAPTQFGAGTPYIGCYGILSLEGSTLTLTAYGLNAAGGGIAGDTVIDTITLGN
jgi:hypothetical protein